MLSFGFHCAGTISVEGTVSKFTIAQLKSRLVHHAKRSRAVMAPLLYELRKRIKAQGRSGEGFGAWVNHIWICPGVQPIVGPTSGPWLTA